MALIIDDLYRTPVPSHPALSPDGRRVAFVVTTAEREADENRSSLWLVATDGGPPVQLTRGHRDTRPAWSPDGRWLAFLRHTGDHPQVWLLPAAGGEPHQLTDLPLGAGEAVWSPDASRVAMAAPVDAAAGDGDSPPDHAPVVVTRVEVKVDGKGLLREVRAQVFVVDVATGRATQVTAHPAGVGRPAWSPDGRHLAYPAPVSADPGVDPAGAAFVVDLVDPLTGPLEPRRLGDGRGQAGPMTFTADGNAVIVAGRPDTEVGHCLLLRVDLRTGEPTDLTAGLDRNVMPGAPAYPGAPPQLIRGGAAVAFCARDRGCTHLYEVPVDGSGPPRLLMGGADRVVSGVATPAGGPPAGDLLAAVVATPRTAGEIVALIEGRERPLTALTAEALPDLDPLLPEELTVPAPDGTPVHAFVFRDADAPAPGPLLLDVHGGPHNAWSPVLDPAHLYHHELVGAGWTVVLVNPRGSDGYGEAFYRGVVEGWGTADAGDFLAVVDALVERGTADPERLALAGYSYGGYTACWLPTQTNRFAAAVAGGCVSDLQSMAGTSDVGHRLSTREFGGAPWDEPERYAARSPLAHVRAVSTPTLVLHGEDDDRCPVGQAEEWFVALRALGVPARLVRYPGASHLFILQGRPSHRAHYGQEILSWLSTHVKDPSSGQARSAKR